MTGQTGDIVLHAVLSSIASFDCSVEVSRLIPTLMETSAVFPHCNFFGFLYGCSKALRLMSCVLNKKNLFSCTF